MRDCVPIPETCSMLALRHIDMRGSSRIPAHLWLLGDDPYFTACQGLQGALQLPGLCREAGSTSKCTRLTAHPESKQRG